MTSFVQQWRATQLRLLKLEAENRQMRACLAEQIKFKQQQLARLREILAELQKLKSNNPHEWKNP